MHIDALKIYCDVVRLRSFSLGAEANRVLQATASLTVQRLEKHLGVPLIDRSCRPWKLTPAGRKFYEGCRRLVEDYYALEAKVRGDQVAADSLVRVAAIYSVNLRDMSRSVRRFTELRPGARVKLEYLHPSRVLERVLNDEVDLGILSFPRGRRGLKVVPWREEPMVMACHPHHRLAREPELAVRRVAGEAFVGFDADLVIRRKIDAFLRQHGAEVKVVLTFDNIEAVKRAVEAGSGVAILPRPTLEHELQARTLVAVPLAGPPFVRPLGLVCRRGRRLSPNTAAFISLLQRNGEPLAETAPAGAGPLAGGAGELTAECRAAEAGGGVTAAG
ncbi:MAG: LysR family transcriptional regulator [Verrucomicrobia bacterium]|nr:LysR family transcriptional regulator [Verrucomicrobiota bacterium]